MSLPVKAPVREGHAEPELLEKSRFYPGEGNLRPTRKSQTAFDPSLLHRRHITTKADPPAGGRLVVSPLTTQFPDLTLFVTVLDANGDAVSGLARDSFLIEEQSNAEATPTPQTVTDFKETVASEVGISFSLVFDVSGSMAGQRLDDAKAAAITFLGNCASNDRGNLIEFASSDQVNLVLPSNWVTADVDQNGQPDLQEAIAGRVDLGATALFDGTAKGIDSLSQEPTPRAVILFTDGQANDDVQYDINSVIAKARNEGVPLYTIGLGDDAAEDVLRNLSEQTGGSYHFAPTAADMADVYSTIAREVRSGYTFRYTTHNPYYDGTTRTVTVTANRTTGTATYVVNYRPQVTFDAATTRLSSQSQPPGVALPIAGMVLDLDADTANQALSATLFYRPTGAAAYDQVLITLTPKGNDTYRFETAVPAGAVVYPGLEWYLRVTDSIQPVVLPFDYNHTPFTVSILENHVPVIIHTEVGRAAPGQPLELTAQVTDNDPGDSVREVLLFYRAHNDQQNTPYLSIAMSDQGGALYAATIPADRVTLAGLDYYLSAWDSHNVRADHGLPDAPHHALAAALSAVDFDNDGDVDGADLAAFTAEFRQGKLSANDLASFAAVFGHNIATIAFAAPTFSIQEDGLPRAVVRLIRLGLSDRTLHVTVIPSEGTAEAGPDFTADPVTVTFAPGQIQQSVDIPIIDDRVSEQDETIHLTLDQPDSGVVLGKQQTTELTIVDNDVALSFSAPSYTVREDGVALTPVKVVRSKPLGDVSVTLRLADGTATTPADYQADPIVVQFQGDAVEQTVTIPVLNDALFEPTETVLLSLGDVIGTGVLDTPATAVLNILDDEVDTAGDTPATARPIFPGQQTNVVCNTNLVMETNVVWMEETGSTNTSTGYWVTNITATPIVVCQTNIAASTVRDFVGSADSADYYRFELPAQTSPVCYRARLTCEPLEASVGFELLDSTGTTLASQTATVGSSNPLERILPPGTYYARVLPVGEEANYTLDLTASEVLDQAGNTLAAARDLGVLIAPRSLDDFVHSLDTDDFYRLELASGANALAYRFTVGLSNLIMEAHLELLDGSGAVLEAATANGPADQLISGLLAPGTYYVRVYIPAVGDTGYHLNLAAVPLPDDAGNTLTMARNLGPIDKQVSVTDGVHGLDTDDYYSFTLEPVTSGAYRLQLLLTNLTGEVNLQLLSAQGTVIQETANPGTAFEALDQTVASGTYYARVHCSSPQDASYASYTLMLSAGIPIADGQPVTTTIDRAGDIDVMAFTGQAGDRITLVMQDQFDYVIDDLYVTIFKPDGTTWLKASGYDGIYLDKTLPASGTYTLIFSAEATSGSYTVWLSNLDEDLRRAPFKVLTDGGSVTNQIDFPGDHDGVTFTGQAGDRITLVMQDEFDYFIDDLYVTIFKPDGTTWLSASGYDGIYLDKTLPTSGTYTLIFSAEATSGSYTVWLSNLDEDLRRAPFKVLTDGGSVTNQIDFPGDHDGVTFTGQAGDRITLVMQDQFNYFGDHLYVTILQPGGATWLSASGYDGIYLDKTLPASGTYTLIFSAEATSGSYTMWLSNLDEDLRRAPFKVLTDGGSVTNQIDFPGDHDGVAFTGQAGDRITLVMQDQFNYFGDHLYVTILQPGGATWLSASGYDGIYLDKTLPASGTYTLIFSAEATSGSYTVSRN